MTAGMGGWLSRVFPDRFILLLLVTVGIASLLPVRGAMAGLVDAATLVAIFALFFLHGVRLPREALLSGFTDWRLHAAILAATYLAFPLAGLALSRLVPSLLPPMLWAGILFLCALTSTVQSSIAFTSMARGNVAGAVAAAAGSNLIGVFLTPLIVGLLLETQGASLSFAGVWKIVALIFLPFVLGHALRPRLIAVVEPRPGLTGFVDKGTILLAVYGAFSAARVGHLWSRVPEGAIAWLIVICLAVLVTILIACWAIGRLGGFGRESRAAILFCGSVKSLASGVPMARILFPGPMAGLVILPVMIFHSMQLILCAWIAARLGRRGEPETDF